MSTPVLEPSRALYEVEDDIEDDAHGAATKVGPMSEAAVQKMMRDAEVSSGVAGSASPAAPAVKAISHTRKLSPPPSSVDVDVDELPVLSERDDDEGEPTLLNPRARALGSVPLAPVAVAGPSASANVVDAIVDELVSSYSDNANTHSIEHAVAPSPETNASASVASSTAMPIAGPTHLSRPAAFPEWLGVTFRPDAHGRDNSLIAAIALGAGVFIVTVFVLWALLL
ncbi:MAG TPA: hypothetical protein VM925_33845 [Labilithrix sp.]|jgi:hypothetical protein|nr:hypothetical protein [Labilithrix sp.]